MSVPPGTTITLKRVLVAKTDDQPQFGHPYINDGVVVGEVLEHVKGPKIISYKMKSKKKYRRKLGSRQLLTKLFIKHINIG